MKICRLWYACVCLAFAAMLPGQGYAANVAALVSDVYGNVTVKTNGSTAPAKLLAGIPLSARIDLPKGARLTMIYVAKGDEYKLSGPGSYQVEASSPKAISGPAVVREASIGGALQGKRISSEHVAQATLTMRDIKIIQPSLEPLAPSGLIALAAPLQFHWQEPAEGLTYQIQLADGQNNMLISKKVTGNTFTLPQDVQLSSGRDYVWSLSSTTPEGSHLASTARIKIASSEIRAQAAKLRPGKDGAVAERIAYGLWLEGEKLAYEAHQVWNELATEFPDQPYIRDRAKLKP